MSNYTVYYNTSNGVECNKQMEQFEETRTEYHNLLQFVREARSPLTNEGWVDILVKVNKLGRKELFSRWFDPCSGFDLDGLRTLREDIEAFRKYCIQHVTPLQQHQPMHQESLSVRPGYEMIEQQLRQPIS